MGVKKYGTALGHRIVLKLYRFFGYKTASFVIDFIAFYYALVTPSVRNSLKSYYDHLGLKLDFLSYYKHIRLFSLSIFDRFISRMQPDDISFERENKEDFLNLKNGGIVLLSHVGGWATAGHSLQADIPPMHIVMFEKTKETIKEVELQAKRKNEDKVKIIDLAKGAIAANVQIAQALMNDEVVAMMADRVVDQRKKVKVKFLQEEVEINRNPFDIAKKFDKPLVAAFVVLVDEQKYKLIFRQITTKNCSVEEMAQGYSDILEQIIKLYPNQWYNFYDFFSKSLISKDDK